MLSTESMLSATAVMLTDGRRKFVYRLRDAQAGRFVDFRDERGVWRYLGRYEPKVGWLYVMDAAAQQLPEVRGFRWIAGAAWSSDASAVEKAGWSVQFHKAT